MTLIVRALPATGDEVAGELEVVDTGDVWSFNGLADLARRIREALADDQR